MCSKSKKTKIAYIILVHQEYSKMIGFRCLDKLQEQFEEMFSQEDIEDAKSYGLSQAFRDNMVAAYVNLYFLYFLE